MSNEFKMVIVARRDLNMSPGKLAAQVGHAAEWACETFEVHMEEDADVYVGYRKCGTPKIVVMVHSQEELLRLVDKAKERGVRTTEVVDEGRTELDPNTLTVCAFGPDRSSKINTVTGGLPRYE